MFDQVGVIEQLQGLAGILAIAGTVRIGDGAQGVEIARKRILFCGVVDQSGAGFDDCCIGNFSAALCAGREILL